MVYTMHRYPAELIDVVSLSDACRLVVRPVLPQDAGAFQAFIRNLSDQSRHNRFFRALPELPESLLEQFTNIDYCSHLALVAEVVEGRAETIVGEARYVMGADGHAAELAVAVADAWQRRGIGRLLLEYLVARASDQGIVLLHGQILPSNEAMLRLAERVGFSLHPDPDEPTLVRVEQPLKAEGVLFAAFQQHPVG